jgi:hypothetical protein
MLFVVESKCTPFMRLMPSGVSLYTVSRVRSVSVSDQKYGVAVPFFREILILAMVRSQMEEIDSREGDRRNVSV